MPPSHPEDGLTSVAVDVSVRNAWTSNAKLRWLAEPGPALDRGSSIIITEGPKPVALFMVDHVAGREPDRVQPMSGQRLTEIERRQASASTGPWTSIVEGRDHDSGEDFILTGTGDHRGPDLYPTWDPAPSATRQHADHDFIAQARQDVPDMAGEIRRLWSLLDLRRGDSSQNETGQDRIPAPAEHHSAVYIVQSDAESDVIQLGAFTSMREAVKAMDQAQTAHQATAWVINIVSVHELARDAFEER